MILNLWLQLAVEWLHESCHVVLPCACRDAGLRRDVGKRLVVAASRFLGATAVCVLLLFVAAEHRKSYWTGCMKASMVILQ